MPNLALMKIAKYYRNQGDNVFLNTGCDAPDFVFISVIFTKNLDRANRIADMYGRDKVVLGGPAFQNPDVQLSYSLEHSMPDYDLFGCNYSLGYTSRGCFRKCPFCVVPLIEGKLRPNCDIYEFWNPKHKHIVLLDNNILALPDHFERIANQIIKEKLTVDFNQGLDIRLINDENAEILSKLRIKPHRRFSWDNLEDEDAVIKGIEILKNYKMNRSVFYTLVGYNTTIKEDLYRLNKLKELKQRAYVMRYNEEDNALYGDMAAWANQPNLFTKKDFNEFVLYRFKSNHKKEANKNGN